MADGTAPTRHGRVWRVVVAAAIGVIGTVALTAHGASASTTPEDPPEYLNASETGGMQEETDYWIGRVPCPELPGVALQQPSGFAGVNSVHTVTVTDDEGGTGGPPIEGPVNVSGGCSCRGASRSALACLLALAVVGIRRRRRL